MLCLIKNRLCSVAEPERTLAEQTGPCVMLWRPRCEFHCAAHVLTMDELQINRQGQCCNAVHEPMFVTVFIMKLMTTALAEEVKA